MKKAIKVTLHILSLLALAGLVFTGNISNKLFGDSNTQKNKKDQPEGLFSAFDTTKALADVPNGSGGSAGGYVDGCGDAGCSSDDGSSDGAP